MVKSVQLHRKRVSTKIGAVILVIITLGTIVALFLIQSPVDLRKRAAEFSSNVSPKSPLVCDINGDNRVNLSDLSSFNRCYSGSACSEEERDSTDVTRDGSIDEDDKTFFTENCIRLTPLEATEDTYVEKDRPNRNHGTSSTARVSNNPKNIAYVKFDIEPLTLVGKTITRTQLTVYGTTKPTTVSVFGVAASWDESTLTWNSKPTGDDKVANLIYTNIRTQDGYYVGIADVTQYVEKYLYNNYIGGQNEVAFVLKTDSNKEFVFNTKETRSSEFVPKLRISWGN